jgi:subtilase family serine protease
MNLRKWGIVGLAFALAGSPPASAQSERAQLELSGRTYHAAVCPRGNPEGTVRCFAHVVTDARGTPVDGKPNPSPAATPAGYGPSSLRAAYGTTSITGTGTPTIAIVDAYGYANAESDLAVYRSQYSLPACTTANGCFKKVDQRGGTSYPRDDTGWSQESALDLDMASAMCPNCKIVLVEAATNSFSNLAAAVSYAKTISGVKAISNSYGGSDSSGTTSYDSTYAATNIAITASTGDSGYGAQYPAASPGVVAVGGTTLNAGGGTRGWTETAWSGGGSGCGLSHPKPSWQVGVSDACAGRMEADISAVADPNTGVAVYGPSSRKTSSWMVFGGTSVSAPLIGALFALRNGTINAAQSVFTHTANLNDVTSGSNGSSCPVSYYCHAQAGYDGPTGLGTPNGLGAFSN